MNPVDNYYMNLPDAKRAPALRLSEIILSADERITEAIKWNNPTFSFGKANIAFIYTYKQVEYINLGFMNAVDLSDPKKLFEGTGQGMRHIKIRSIKEIPVTQIKKWVKEAILLNQIQAGVL